MAASSDHHLDRFEQSVAAMYLKNPYTRAQVVDILMRLVRLTGLREAYVEVLVTRGMPKQATRDPRLCENRFYAFVVPFIWIATDEMRARGIHLHVSDVVRIPPQSLNPAIKNFHWADMTKGLMQAYERGCDMPVLLDLAGGIAEGPGFNLFAVKDGTVTTPAGTCLLGISRQTALDLLQEQNVKTVMARSARPSCGRPTRCSSRARRAASCRSRGSTTSRSATASSGRCRRA